MPAELTYRAFLSYSHTDSEQAETWHALLESFAVHPPFAGMPTPAGLVPEHLRPVFRERVHFSGGKELTEQSRSALRAHW